MTAPPHPILKMFMNGFQHTNHKQKRTNNKTMRIIIGIFIVRP